jgi:hypothetical protein
MKLEAVYRGKTEYGGARFSVSRDNEKVFKKLIKIKKKIDEKDYKTYNPVYMKDLTAKSISLTFKNSLVDLKQTDKDSTFEIKFSIFEKTYEGKTFVNFQITNSKLVSKADRGKEVTDYDSDSD